LTSPDAIPQIISALIVIICASPARVRSIFISKLAEEVVAQGRTRLVNPRVPLGESAPASHEDDACASRASRAFNGADMKGDLVVEEVA